MHDSGQQEAAQHLLQQQLARDPANREVRMALASYLHSAGKRQEAARLVSEVQLINPFDPMLRGNR